MCLYLYTSILRTIVKVLKAGVYIFAHPSPPPNNPNRKVFCFFFFHSALKTKIKIKTQKTVQLWTVRLVAQ